MIDLKNTERFKFLTLDTFEKVDVPYPDVGFRGAPLLVAYSEDDGRELAILSLN